MTREYQEASFQKFSLISQGLCFSPGWLETYSITTRCQQTFSNLYLCEWLVADIQETFEDYKTTVAFAYSMWGTREIFLLDL